MLEHLKYVFACAALLWLQDQHSITLRRVVLHTDVLGDHGPCLGCPASEFVVHEDDQF